MGKRLERFCEVGIVDETNGVRLDFVKKEERVSNQYSKTIVFFDAANFPFQNHIFTTEDIMSLSAEI